MLITKKKYLLLQSKKNYVFKLMYLYFERHLKNKFSLIFSFKYYLIILYLFRLKIPPKFWINWRSKLWVFQIYNAYALIRVLKQTKKFRIFINFELFYFIWLISRQYMPFYMNCILKIFFIFVLERFEWQKYIFTMCI